MLWNMLIKHKSLLSVRFYWRLKANVSGRENSERWRALSIFPVFTSSIFWFYLCLRLKVPANRKQSFGFFFLEAFDRAGCFFRSACFSRCYFCLIVHSGKIRSNPLERWYECWYVNNINNRWKCGDLMMDWVEVRFSFCFSRKTRCDGAKYSIFPIFFYLDLDVDSASMQLPEENPENHWGFTALGDFTDAKIKKRWSANVSKLVFKSQTLVFYFVSWRKRCTWGMFGSGFYPLVMNINMKFGNFYLCQDFFTARHKNLFNKEIKTYFISWKIAVKSVLRKSPRKV